MLSLRAYPCDYLYLALLLLPQVRDQFGYCFGLQLRFELIHLDCAHVDLYPNSEHLEILNGKHTIHIIVTQVQHAQVFECERVIFRVLCLN